MTPWRMLFLTVFTFVSCTTSLVMSQTLQTPELSIDQIIQRAAQTSLAMDFVQDNDTVLVELDIRYKKEDWEIVQQSGLADDDDDDDDIDRGKRSTRVKRKAIYNKRWTNRQVPYIISNTFSSYNRQTVLASMNEYHRHTCLRFRPATGNDYNKIVIQNGGGCSSFVGMSGGGQSVSLAPGCRVKGTIMHELGHAIGLNHEQTRPDRDQYVTIMRQNIPPSVYYNFQKYNWNYIKNYHVGYDYTSMMHYGPTAFSINGRPTIVAKDARYRNKLGNRRGFSFRDIKVINLMYNCNSQCTRKLKCPGEGFQGKDCKCWCPTSGGSIGLCSGTGGGTTTTTTTGTGTGGCRDKSEHCTGWKQSGYCTDSRYQSYMRANCSESCGVCGTRPVRPTTPTPTITTGRGCADTHGSCLAWKRYGYCTSAMYLSTMRTKCRKTCGFCGTRSRCMNQNQFCGPWAQRGFCRSYQYAPYMRKNCPVSCGYCRASSNTAAAAPCADANTNCGIWATRGECQFNPNYMLLYCQRSCGTCTQG